LQSLASQTACAQRPPETLLRRHTR
jgi:hypothetical protein